ncbi:hypothetical protein H0H87_002202, partial [Tephrocybe sp. NHM501043]
HDDVVFLEQNLRLTHSEDDFLAEEESWIAQDVLESTPMKGKELSMSPLHNFFGEMDRLFGGEAFRPLIGVISSNEDIKKRMQEVDGWKEEADFDRDRRATGQKILTKEEKTQRRTVWESRPLVFSEIFVTGRKRTNAHKKRIAQLAQNLEQKLEPFTDSMTSPQEFHSSVPRIWQEMCESEA